MNSSSGEICHYLLTGLVHDKRASVAGQDAVDYADDLVEVCPRDAIAGAHEEDGKSVFPSRAGMMAYVMASTAMSSGEAGRSALYVL